MRSGPPYRDSRRLQVLRVLDKVNRRSLDQTWDGLKALGLTDGQAAAMMALVLGGEWEVVHG